MSFLCVFITPNNLYTLPLTLDIKVSEVPIDTPKILSPREVVEKIKEHNPNFNQFLKDFDLGLA